MQGFFTFMQNLLPTIFAFLVLAQIATAMDFGGLGWSSDDGRPTMAPSSEANSRNEFYFVLAGHQHNAFSVGEGAGSTSTQNSRIQVYSIE